MSDKDYLLQIKRIKKYLNKWQKPAGFGWFNIDIEFAREDDTDAPSTLGECWSQWQYRSATIRFYLPVAKEQSDDELEKAVLHELCHLLVSPLQDLSDPRNRQITEYTTSCVADALYRAHTHVKTE